MPDDNVNAFNRTIMLLDAQQKEREAREALVEALKTYPAAKDVLEHLAFAEEHYKVSNVQGIVNSIECDYYEVVKVLKHLDVHKLGQFIVGRKGKDTRIVWNFHPRSIGNLAFNESNSLSPISNEMKEYDGGVENRETISHNFYLRPNFNLELKLPKDFNRKDLNRLEKWLDTIPFD